MSIAGPRAPIQNRILSALPESKYKRFLSSLQPVSLNLSQVLYEAGDPVRYVYFPDDAMISLIATREDGGMGVEVGVVGEDGMLGTSAFLGGRVALSKALVQLAGTAWRAKVDALMDAVEGRDRVLQKMLQGYAQVVLTQVTRSAACYRFHNVEQRLARWLLITHDHAKSDTFPMTHEFISNLLGTRRPDVTKAASGLQRKGLVRYRRGRLTVTDRRGLEEASCNCYRIVREEIDRLYGDGDGSGG